MGGAVVLRHSCAAVNSGEFDLEPGILSREWLELLAPEGFPLLLFARMAAVRMGLPQKNDPASPRADGDLFFSLPRERRQLRGNFGQCKLISAGLS